MDGDWGNYAMTTSSENVDQWVSVLVVPGQKITSVRVINRVDGSPYEDWLYGSQVWLSNTVGGTAEGTDRLCGTLDGTGRASMANAQRRQFDIDCTADNEHFNWVTVIKRATAGAEYLSVGEIEVYGFLDLTWYQSQDIALSSTFSSTYAAYNCHDDNINDQICASNTQAGVDEWLEVDLGDGGRPVESVLVYNRLESSLSAYLGQYKIQVANANRFWVDCNNDGTATAVAPLGPFSTPCNQGNNINFRYVRLLLPLGGYTSRFLSIQELVVLGGGEPLSGVVDHSLVEG